MAREARLDRVIRKAETLTAEDGAHTGIAVGIPGGESCKSIFFGVERGKGAEDRRNCQNRVIAEI